MKIGVIAGAFDVIHPGYIEMFQRAKKHCSHLIIFLNKDPSLFNRKKLRPILGWWERKEILLSIRYVDEVIPYLGEKELEVLLKNTKYDVRFLGFDYIEKPITGEKDSRIIYLNRDHDWSATKFINLIVKRGSVK